MQNWQHFDLGANDISLHYCRTGNSQLPLLILSHGFSDSGLCWLRVAQDLASKFDVVMVDARNHGLSSRAEASADAMVEDLAALIQLLADGRKPILLGHSMGASTTAGVAAKYPDLVSAVLLEDPPWWSSKGPEKSESEKQVESAKRAEAFQKYLDEVKSKTHAELINYARKLYPDWAEEDLPDWAISKQQVDESAMDGLKLPDWRSIALNLKVPTLLIHSDGSRDGLLKKDEVEQLKKENTHLESAEIEKAGHNIRRENFTDYMAAVRSFLDKQLTP